MDHCRREKRETNPRVTANIFSFLTFAYVGSLFKKAIKKDLDDDDIYEVLERHRSKKCGDQLERQWMIERKRQKKPSLARVIWKCYGRRYLLIGLIDFIYNTTSSVVRPYVISHFVAYFTQGQTTLTRADAYFYGCSILMTHCISLIYNHNYMLWVQMFGMEIRTAFSSLLYRKALKLSPTAAAETNLGNIVNLITRDVESFVRVVFTVNDGWVAASQVLIICYLLFNKVGAVSFVGIGILLSVIPIQVYLCSWITKFRLQTCKRTDERLQASQEILSTMRIIKMYTWETFFTKKVVTARNKEMRKLILGTYFREVLFNLANMLSSLGFYILIIVCVWVGVSTDTSIIFYILSNFRDLRHFLAIVVPYGMGMASQFVSSYKRVVSALQAEELTEDLKQEGYTDEPLIHLKEVTVQIKEQYILRDISFKITSGLTVVTGKVGSGKSSLLKTILMNMPLKSGVIAKEGRISYASQDPWLFPSSIKQNILFGQPFNAERYQEVVKVCALLFDLDLFEKGDETILTDRGLNLSKGQQARINLARAVYRESEIYLLDDSLTALDASVQKYIFSECVKKYLKHKICILVSQTNSHVQEADTVIIMDDGRIKEMEASSERTTKEANEIIAVEKDLDEQLLEDNNKETVDESTENTALIETQQVSKTNVYSEVKKQGSVDWKVYKLYFIYGGGFLLVLLNILMRGSTQFAVSYSDRLLTRWVDEKQIVLNIQKNVSSYTRTNDSYFNETSLEAAKLSEQNTFTLYSIVNVLSAILELVTSYLLLDFCRRASVNLHNTMISKVITAVMRFFDTHLIGNILNRLSQDMLSLDEYMSVTLGECCRTIFAVAGILFIVVLINPYSFIIIGLVFASLFILRRCYLPAGRSLKRLEASTRSPMVGHLNATLEGLTTVRASKVQSILIEEYDKHQDLYTSANFISICSARAFGFFVDVVSSAFLIFLILKYLFFNSGHTAGDIGLSITQVFALSITLTWFVRMFTDLETYMTSLERVVEYTDIKTEQKGGSVLKNWPYNGSISYQNVSLSYGNSENFVLKNINFEIKSKEKIGIVGRTGAGKSSIISTIFRLYDIKGKILIDGIDIKTLALDFLRQNIVVIPQDPIIFSGTIRSNLDPLGEFEDNSLWGALDIVGMKQSIPELEQEINSNMLNFSSGQKQLLCLARAILRKNKIVIMDEATANMDQETDKILHKIIKENFSDCTVLTIAHRLHSVLECDKVIVLDKGEIKEFDRPATLLDNKKGMFYAMVEQAGLLTRLNS